MSDPRRPQEPDPNRPQWSQPTERFGNPYQPVDPAYAGQYSYPSYIPGSADNPTEALPPYWTQTQYAQQQQPVPPNPPPPGPPKSPRWLWLVAGSAVLLVVGLVVALVIANGATRDETVVAPLPPMPEPSEITSPPTTSLEPTTTTTPAPTTTSRSPQTTSPGVVPPTTPTTESGATEDVVYTVNGAGRAISITYIDTGGVLQMEFNVVLPWRREVSLSPTTAKAASVTVINVGRDVTCSVAVNGSQLQQRTGSGLTICSSAG
jgi:hypothetical protein